MNIFSLWAESFINGIIWYVLTFVAVVGYIILYKYIKQNGFPKKFFIWCLLFCCAIYGIGEFAKNKRHNEFVNRQIQKVETNLTILEKYHNTCREMFDKNKDIDYKFASKVLNGKDDIEYSKEIEWDIKYIDTDNKKYAELKTRYDRYKEKRRALIEDESNYWRSTHRLY